MIADPPSGDLERPRTLMWEAKAAPDRGDELVAWVLAHAATGQVYRAAERVVLVVDLADGVPPPEPPAELVARAPHAWRFRRVR